MTTNNDTPADAITVIQADRDLVYSLFWFGAKTELEKRALEYIRDGKGDDARAVQEVARHRTTSLAAQDGLVDKLKIAFWASIQNANGDHKYLDYDTLNEIISAAWTGFEDAARSALASIEVKS